LPEWLTEAGIGEVRTVLVDDGQIIEARIAREGIIPAGTILAARLVSGGRNAIARAGTQEYLLPKGAPGVNEGALLNIEVTREALAGAEPWKRPLARLSDEPPRSASPQQARSLAFPAASDELEAAGWSDLVDEARSGMVYFPGGALRISATPAMTLIDVDGTLELEPLALAGAAAAAAAIRRLDIGGSIGIDLPTIGGKAARQAVAEAVDAILPQPFERTAVNGFGFLQIVRPRRRASLVELAFDRASFEARALLRRAARETGAIRLVAHPRVIAAIDAQPGWIDRLCGHIGGTATLRAEPTLAMAAGYAEPA
jgi:hypothetical protein